MRRLFALLPALVASAAFAQDAAEPERSPATSPPSAAIGPLRIDERQTRLEETRFRGGTSPLGQRLVGGLDRTVRFETWHGEFSALGGRRSSLQDERSRLDDRVPEADVRTPEAREREINRWSGRRTGIDGADTVTSAFDRPRVSEFQRRIDEAELISREEFILGTEAPRMEDINRFVFRKNGTARGEAPATPAGGGN